MSRRKAKKKNQPSRNESQPEGSSIKRYQNQMKERFWMTLNYLSISFSSALIFGFAALCEYVLAVVIWSILGEDIRASEIMSTIAQVAQIAVFVLTLVAFVIHAGYSLYGTYQVDKQFAGNKL